MLDIKTLESWLWEGACTLRGKLDAPKYKDYILPLVFVKRLSDVFDDEIEKLSKEYDSKEMALKLVEKDHSLVRFYIDPEYSWSEIRTHKPDGLGAFLTDVVRGIAKENKELEGVINVVDFNASTSGERILPDETLSKLIETLSKHRLGLEDAEPDILGRAYEYLLRKFAEGQGQSAGEFYTPKEVGWIMAYILNPEQGQTVYDPAVGSGGLLIKCSLSLKEKEEKVDKPLTLYGQEQNPVTYAMAKMNMFIHDMDGKIAIGDTLRNPKFTVGSSLKKFDLVTANPMWNQDGYDSDFYENDKYGRFKYGYPTAQSADWGWVQHMTTSLNDNGRAAVVLDTGAVSRGSGNKNKNAEKEIRKAMVEEDLIEAVLLLPDNLFYNTTAPGIIIFINKNKPKDRREKVLLINATEEYKKSKESSKNYIPEESIKKIVKAYEEGKDIEKFTKVVDLEEIRKNDYNISPSRYIHSGETKELREISEILSEIEELKRDEKGVDGKLDEIINKLNL
jgi:type I restriction enzyme M protein